MVRPDSLPAGLRVRSRADQGRARHRARPDVRPGRVQRRWLSRQQYRTSLRLRRRLQVRHWRRPGYQHRRGGPLRDKWIYTEFDLTGQDSLLPFIPVLTVARAGGQPFATIANYKVYYANGDFAGLDLYTTLTPGIKNHLAWVDVEDTLAGGDWSANKQTRTDRGKDFAIIESPEFTPFKGLDLKPMFSWFHVDGVTSNSARRNATNRRPRRLFSAAERQRDAERRTHSLLALHPNPPTVEFHKLPTQ